MRQAGRSWKPALTTLAALTLSASLASAGHDKRGDELKLDYKRGGPKRTAVHKPDKRAALPEPLRRETVVVVVSEVEHDASTPAARTRPGHASHEAPEAPVVVDRTRAIERDARTAAFWAAEHVARHHGEVQYYRAGFFEGLHRALNDHHLGEWDLVEGRRLGRRDPQAWVMGGANGEAAARGEAEADAERQVAEQFLDLGREPSFRPYAAAPFFEAPPAVVDMPTLQAVFDDYPMIGFEPLRQRTRLYFAGWDYADARRLSACDSIAEFYRDDWRDADAAFDEWHGERHRAQPYRRLAPAERELFRSVFAESFNARLGHLFDHGLVSAHERGFDDGWHYGAFVHQELDFRIGYREGFIQAFAEAASGGFLAFYPRFYNDAYAERFAAWSTEARPEIGSVWLADGNDDGVFAPGEIVFVEYELINYGGGEGGFPVAVTGSILERSSEDRVVLPARSVTRERQPLSARIRHGTPVRTRAELEFRLGDQWTGVALDVSHPLQLERSAVRAYRDNLAGEVLVEVAVANRSRLPVEAAVEVAARGRAGFAESREIGVLPPDGRRTLTFAVDGLAPLDLIAGNVALDLRARSGEVIQDAWTHHLPDAARDLGSRDLLLYMVGRARSTEVHASEVAALHDLLLTRLREDWKVAVMRSGNPYKRDRKRQQAETALGDLVQTYRVERHGMASPQVFEGLSYEVVALADTLPGIHPFLRKSMRKLAGELP
jgi:hypothetical protein